METEVHTQGTENGKADRMEDKDTGREKMDKTKGEGLPDTRRRERGDLGRIGEMGMQADRKGEGGGP